MRRLEETGSTLLKCTGLACICNIDARVRGTAVAFSCGDSLRELFLKLHEHLFVLAELKDRSSYKSVVAKVINEPSAALSTNPVEFRF